MTETQPKISVVVLNWNGKKFIDSFMKSFKTLVYPASQLELLFVDNKSSDESVAYLVSKYNKDNRIKVIQNDKNYGYSKGNNLGIHHASGDYILVCNNDLQLESNLIKELVQVALEYKADAVVPKLMYLNNPGVINNAGSRLDTKSDWPIYEIGKDELDKGQFDEVREITALCGACMLIKRDFLQTVGLFDNRFFMYFEDGDLSWRGQKVGKKYYYAPKAVAYHFHAGSSKEGSPLFNFYVGRNRILILTKNASLMILLKAWAKTVRDHLFLRVKNLLMSINGRYSKRTALKEFWLSLKMVVSAILLTPYAILKRWQIIKEETL